MITEDAIVVEIDNNETWIETQRKSSCGQCSANKGCGTSVLSNVLGNKLSKMKAINKIDAQVGDKVVVGLSEDVLLKGAYMTYIMPLIYLLVFSIFGQFISTYLNILENEILIISFSVIGFYLGIRHLKRFSQSIRSNENYHPVILNKSDHFPVLIKR